MGSCGDGGELPLAGRQILACDRYRLGHRPVISTPLVLLREVEAGALSLTATSMGQLKPAEGGGAEPCVWGVSWLWRRLNVQSGQHE